MTLAFWYVLVKISEIVQNENYTEDKSLTYKL